MTGERLETAVVDVRAETETVLAEFDAVVDALVAASPFDALDGPSPCVGTVLAAVSRSSTEASLKSERSEA